MIKIQEKRAKIQEKRAKIKEKRFVNIISRIKNQNE